MQIIILSYRAFRIIESYIRNFRYCIIKKYKEKYIRYATVTIISKRGRKKERKKKHHKATELNELKLDEWKRKNELYL